MLFALATLAACGGGGGGGGDAGAGASSAAPSPDNVAGFVYVANFAGNNVSAYTINDSTGALSEIAGSPFAAGIGPTSVAIDPSGKFAYVANGGSFDFTDTISVYTINPATGALTSVGAASAGRSSLRSITVDPSGKFIYTTSGGSRTSSFDVSAYTINATTGALSVAAGSPFFAGTNPSSVTVDPSGKFAYVTNQASGDVSAFAINAATGALIPTVRTSTGSAPLCVRVDPSGKFAYVAGSGVSAYTIDATTGALSEIAGSPFAAANGFGSIAIEPSGKFAYLVVGGGISAYAINAATGALTEIAGSPFAAQSGSGAITVDPSGKFVYVAGGGVSAYAINAATGSLSEVAGSPFAAGTGSSITTARRIQ
jgi:6-phosphogluconolactonase